MDIFSLSGQVKTLYDMLTENPEDEQVINDTIEAVMGEIEVQAEQLVNMRNKFDMEIDACKKQEDFWKARRDARENAKARLDKYIIDALAVLKKDRIPAGDVMLKAENNGGKIPLIYVEGAKVPEKYIKTITKQENDNDAVRKALERGEKLDFAHFGERGKHIMIR